MNENKWFTCAEFNAKTEANYRKHQAKKRMLLRLGNRMVRAKRRENCLIALDLSVIATCLLAVGVLIGCAI
jgi:hypothetical protein